MSASRLFDRFGQGVVVRQLITDSGRTSNLVASSRLQAQATAQNSQATRYDVLLQVNRAYFDVLHAQAVVKVAQETVGARQLLSDQVTELAKNKLRSQLDVSFADVNVSAGETAAAPRAGQRAGRARGTGPGHGLGPARELSACRGAAAARTARLPPTIWSRRRSAIARSSRASAFRAMPPTSSPTRKRISRGPPSARSRWAGSFPSSTRHRPLPFPLEYEGLAANVSIPVFNGHLFAARREAALQRAMESDQRLRDEQQRVSRDVRVAWAGAERRVSADRCHGAVSCARRRSLWISRRGAITSACPPSSS